MQARQQYKNADTSRKRMMGLGRQCCVCTSSPLPFTDNMNDAACGCTARAVVRMVLTVSTRLYDNCSRAIGWFFRRQACCRHPVSSIMRAYLTRRSYVFGKNGEL